MNFPDDPVKKLIAIMSHLRSPGGCPWDRLQTPETLKPYLLEEAYEVFSAIDSDDPDEIRDELGDLLLQIVFLADIYKERNLFDVDAIAESICQKLIRRHPHVFNDSPEKNLEKLYLQWEAIKNSEKNSQEHSILEHLQAKLPALLLAQKVSNKVARVGFDWLDVKAVRLQLDTELAELEQAVASNDSRAISHEMGDILFTIVNLGRHLEIDCESALLEMVERFRGRFEKMEELIKADNKKIDQIGIDQLNEYWSKVKALANAKS